LVLGAVAGCGDDDDVETDAGDATTTTTEVEEATITTTTEAETTTTTTAESDAPGDDIVAVATTAGATFVPTYTEFAEGYAQAIGGDGPVTALMPSDDAFLAFSTEYPALTQQLREDFETLDQLLLYHTIDGEMLAEAISGATELETLQGEPITVEVVDGAVVLNGGQASVTEADLAASNGVVHIVDGILLPPSMADSAS
jgi:uncharacterized surface protein with fasciclin (FAS1) repeats